MKESTTFKKHFDPSYCDISDTRFDFEDYVIENLGLDIYGLNKQNTRGGICIQYLRGRCTRGIQCPYKHIRSEKAVVCKHWLRGLCKKEDLCEFLHEYTMTKMPECYFYSEYGECANENDCIYLHVDPQTKIPECISYNQGFCKLGPLCKNRHIKKLPCFLYLAGFCPKGPECSDGHPKFEAPIEKEKNVSNFKDNNNFGPGFKYRNNQNSQFQPYQKNSNFNNNNNTRDGNQKFTKKLEDVLCFKCEKYGHYANVCTTFVQRHQ